MSYSDELFHHGVKGQRWGVRRYQNKNGSLTNRGKRKLARYYKNKINFLEDQNAGFEKEKGSLEGYRSYAKKKYERLKKRSKDPLRVQKWLDEYNYTNKEYKELTNKQSANRKEIDALIKKVSKNPNLLLYNRRYETSYQKPSNVVAEASIDLFKDTAVRVGGVDRQTLPKTTRVYNDIEYDVTKVVANTKRNRKKVYRKNEKKQGYKYGMSFYK